jgi:hypothetical protein
MLIAICFPCFSLVKMPLNYIKSQKGNDLLVHDGFIYQKNWEKNDTVYWKCVESRKGCRRTCRVEQGLIQDIKEHDHPQETKKVEVRAACNALCQQATESHDAPRQMVAGILAGMSEAAIGK